MDQHTATTSDPTLPPPSRRGKGFLALSATLFLPGLGQFLAGRHRRGLIWFSISILVSLIGIGLLGLRGRVLLILFPLVTLEVILSLAVIIDAYLIGRRTGGRMLSRPWLRYLAGLFVLVMAFFLQPSKLIAIAQRPYWAEAFVMPTPSMNPTIIPGDRFLVSKGFRAWHRWDIVALHPPAEPKNVYCKRIAGLPGETVEIRSGVLHINGAPVAPPPGIGPYTAISPMAIYGTEGHPITLGSDEYFVLGDNSPISGDSRYWPTQPHESQLVGHVTLIYWPLQRIRVFD